MTTDPAVTAWADVVDFTRAEPYDDPDAPVRCPACGGGFYDGSLLYRHQAKAHPDFDPWRCPMHLNGGRLRCIHATGHDGPHVYHASDAPQGRDTEPGVQD